MPLPRPPFDALSGLSTWTEARHVLAALGVFSTSSHDTALAYVGDGGELLEIFVCIENPHYMRMEDLIAL